MLFLQPMPMDDVAAANRPVAAEVSVMKARARAAPAWNGMRLAQAPGGASGPAFDPNAGSQLQQPGSPGSAAPDVNPPRPNGVDTSNGRSPFNDNAAGMGADPGKATTQPIVPAPPATPDAAAPSTPAPTTTPPQPIDDTKAPGVPDQTPLPGTGGTSGPMTPPSQTPTPNTAEPGAGTAAPPAAAPSATTPAPGATTLPPNASTPSPTDTGASGTR